MTKAGGFAAALLKNRVVKNANWMIAEQGVQMLVSLIIGMLTARYLGPSNYGIINYCYAYVSFFTAVAGLGLEAVVVKELIENREREAEVLGSSVLLRLIAGTLSLFAVVLILAVADKSDTLIMTVGFLQSLVFIFKAFEMFDFWFQSRLESKYSSLLKSLSYILVAFYKFYILWSAKSVKWFAFSTSLDFLIIAVFLLIAYFRHGGRRLRVSAEISKRLLSQGYHFIISNLIITIYAQTDRVMLKHLLGEREVGLYSAALMICTYWHLVPTAIINAVRPVIMEAKAEKNEELYKKNFSRLYSLLSWLGLFVSLLISLLAGPIVSVAYGQDYASASGTLRIAIWMTVFSSLGVASANWLVCENKNKYEKWFVLSGALVNVILNALLIPRFGPEGAAVATLITQLTVCYVGPALFPETRENARQLLRALVFK